MASGVVTLLDIAKNMPDSFAKGVILTYATTTQPLMVMPTPTEPTGIHKWKMVNQLAYSTSSSAYRKLDAEFNNTKTPTEPYSANIKIAGGRVKIDRVNKRMSPADTEIQRIGQVQSQAYVLTKDIFEGTGGDYLWGISGQMDEVPYLSNQTVNMGTTSAGAILTLDAMDEFVSKLNQQPGSSYIYMNDTPYRLLQKLSRGQAGASDLITQNLNYDPSQFGIWAGTYAGIPIIRTVDGAGDDWLSNTQGDGSSTTVYGVTYGPENFTGFQENPMSVMELKEISVQEAFDLEWTPGTAAKSRRCVARLRYVSNSLT